MQLADVNLHDPTPHKLFGTISPDGAYSIGNREGNHFIIILEGAENLDIPAPLLWQASLACSLVIPESPTPLTGIQPMPDFLDYFPGSFAA